jgi:hypothetical protein
VLALTKINGLGLSIKGGRTRSGGNKRATDTWLEPSDKMRIEALYRRPHDEARLDGQRRPLGGGGMKRALFLGTARLGIGMTPEQQAKLFEEFTQADGKRPGGASGGRAAALHVTDDTARHLRYTSRAKREADVAHSLHHPTHGISIVHGLLHRRTCSCDRGAHTSWSSLLLVYASLS